MKKRDGHDKETCPYCALMILAGSGLKRTAQELYENDDDYQTAITRVASFLGPALDLLGNACEDARQKKIAPDKSKLN